MNFFDKLNPQQREAVMHTEGPLLILAGAGSGKTRVLTSRIAYLIGEKGVKPWNIMAITFTNKAAGEMRERVLKTAPEGAESIWVATFHSSCVRILRRYIDRIGYGNDFSIYDTDDSKTVIKEVIKGLQVDTRLYKDRMILSAISAAKNEMLSPEEYLKIAEGDSKEITIARCYKAYQTRLFNNNALDFDDLLLKTVELFESCPDVLENYQDRLRYLMVDEYQDTNTVQFRFISLLAEKYRNLCVVGDDDQSIYKFRGANIGNILGFEKVFPDAKVIRLEQNYRSTQKILDAANEVIRNNTERKEKKLWTDKLEGKEVQLQQFDSSFEEAEFVAGDISRLIREGKNGWKDFAILYRTNAQSRLFEEKFLLANIPYKLVGGVNFYSRKEIKDVLAYLKTIDNARDEVAVRRIINIPKRGIGAASLAKVSQFALAQGLGFYEALESLEIKKIAGRSGEKIGSFTALIREIRSQLPHLNVEETIKEVLKTTGYAEELEMEDSDEARTRLENIDELISKAADFDKQYPDGNLTEFLAEVALVADIDSLEDSDDRVLLMTLHSAKGLEFPRVYLTGMEDGIFPSYLSIISDDPLAVEEERRLCYVGITRAMDHLTLTYARSRMLRGEMQYNRISRFVKEIPRDMLGMKEAFPPERKKVELPASSAHQQMKETFHSQGWKAKQFTVTKADKLSYDVGDRVRHMKFGIGIVAEILEGGKDYEVTVDFESAGRKRMFAGFAKLKKL